MAIYNPDTLIPINISRISIDGESSDYEVPMHNCVTGFDNPRIITCN